MRKGEKHTFLREKGKILNYVSLATKDTTIKGRADLDGRKITEQWKLEYRITRTGKTKYFMEYRNTIILMEYQWGPESCWKIIFFMRRGNIIESTG